MQDTKLAEAAAAPPATSAQPAAAAAEEAAEAKPAPTGAPGQVDGTAAACRRIGGGGARSDGPTGCRWRGRRSRAGGSAATAGAARSRCIRT